MKFLESLYNGTWKLLKETGSNVPLEPLELSQIECGIIIARLKKLAKDPAYKCANALQLVHDSYKEQDWERQNSYGDFVRPTPSNKKAWKQYEEMIATAVKLLSKYRGVKGDWRTDRFTAIPTNDRSSMGSTVASTIENASFTVDWSKAILTEQALNISDLSVDDYLIQLSEQLARKNQFIVLNDSQALDSGLIQIQVFDKTGNVVNEGRITLFTHK